MPDRKTAEQLKAAAVTRFEVIDDTGRVISRHGVRVALSYQDDGRTLKVFLSYVHVDGETL